MPARRKKFCPHCRNNLPIANFGECKARPDGLNCYCKQCALDKVHVFRQRVRAMKAAQKEQKKLIEALERKQAVPSLAKVRNAVKAGCATRDEIQATTQLDWDQLGDALAELTFERGVLRIERVGSKRKFRLAA